MCLYVCECVLFGMLSVCVYCVVCYVCIYVYVYCVVCYVHIEYRPKVWKHHRNLIVYLF